MHSSACMGCWGVFCCMCSACADFYWAQAEERRAAYWLVMTEQEAGVSALIIQTLTHDIQKHWPGAPNAGAGIGS